MRRDPLETTGFISNDKKKSKNTSLRHTLDNIAQSSSPTAHALFNKLCTTRNGQPLCSPKCVGVVATIILILLVHRIWLKPDYEPEIDKLEFTLQNILSVGLGLSKMAGEKIVAIKQQHQEEAKVKGQTAEGANELVTNADKESNNIFINGFRTLFHHVNLVSEETNPQPEVIIAPTEPVQVPNGDEILDAANTIIIVDPLDATQEYKEEKDKDGTNMLPYVTTLVCVVQNGRPIAGIINRPFVKDEPPMWAVVKEKKISGLKVTEPDATAAGKITLSRSHTGAGKDVVKEYLAPHTSLPAGGAGYKAWLVLTGQVDAYIHVTAIKIWDICAGHAFLLAAGGDVTDKAGKTLTYDAAKPKFLNGLIAAQSQSKIKDFASKLADVDLGKKNKN